MQETYRDYLITAVRISGGVMVTAIPKKGADFRLKALHDAFKTNVPSQNRIAKEVESLKTEIDDIYRDLKKQETNHV